MKIGIIFGSIRDGRFGEGVGRWVAEQAATREGVDYEVLDLKAFEVPLLTAALVPGAAQKRYADPKVQAWSDAIDGCDGFLFVTPEYNHGVPGAFKNAFDSLGNEWFGKAVGFVGYGFDGGVRAIEQWRQIVLNFQMVDVRAVVPLSLIGDKDAEGFAPQPHRGRELIALFDQLEAASARNLDVRA